MLSPCPHHGLPAVHWLSPGMATPGKWMPCPGGAHRVCPSLHKSSVCAGTIPVCGQTPTGEGQSSSGEAGYSRPSAHGSASLPTCPTGSCSVLGDLPAVRCGPDARHGQRCAIEEAQQKESEKGDGRGPQAGLWAVLLGAVLHQVQHQPGLRFCKKQRVCQAWACVGGARPVPSPAPTLRRGHWQPVPSLRTEAADAQGRGQDPAARKTPAGLPPLGSQDTLGRDVAGQEGGHGSAAPRTAKGHGLLTPSPACFLSKPLFWAFLAWALGGAGGDRPSPPSGCSSLRHGSWSVTQWAKGWMDKTRGSVALPGNGC